MEKFQKHKKKLFTLIWILSASFFGFIAGLSGIYLYLSPTLPGIESLKQIELQTPLRIYSIDNQLIGQFGEKRREPILLREAPKALVDAVLSAEDDGFYHHQGVDFKGLLRAVAELLLSGEIQSGGSTITMQVARNFFLSREQTFSRKFNEILLALKIEKELSKEDILQLYLNRIYLGNRAYGVKAAAQVYYGKPLDELTLAQLAMIAGLPKAPSKFNPIVNSERALIRRNWILKRMLTLDKIDSESYQTAISQPISSSYFGQNLDMNAPYVAEAARDKTVELYGEDAYTKGYKVVTTVHSKLQLKAQEALHEGLLAYDRRHGYRGSEQQLDPGQLQIFENETKQNENTSSPLTMDIAEHGLVNIEPWIDELNTIPSYGGLVAAAVLKAGETHLSVLLRDASVIEIPFTNGINDWRQYINENYAADPPNPISKYFDVGDVVRLRWRNDQWFLSQLPNIEGTIVSLSSADGAIQSMVGGFDFNQSSFNRATQAKRQPGSNFKPFIYAYGLENNITPATIFNDAPIVVEDSGLERIWRPENASGKFYGPTRLRKALYLSRNLVSIRLLRSIGVRKTADSLLRFGINPDTVSKDLSMALGSHVMTPLEVATGYSVFANGGYRVNPYLIHHIRDRYDEVIYQAQPLVVPESAPRSFVEFEASDEKEKDSTESPFLTDSNLIGNMIEPVVISSQKNQPIIVELKGIPAERVMDERVAYLMNSMLRDVISRGTGRRALVLSRSDLAGKTGTTNGPTDAWFSGYNPDIVTTTWVGFDNNQSLGRGEYGGVAALPIWIDYMSLALENSPEKKSKQPDGIVTVLIDPESGERAAPDNPKGIFEFFLEENAPKPLRRAEGNKAGPTDNPLPEDLF